ncbi:MAG: histidine phosphatase family protein [Chloroflexota bacterium]|jgi:broad specificity phosphatase PhoE
MTKTTILLIRHGQTDWNVIKRSQGHLDIPLNQVGRRQSELLAQRLSGWPVNAVYSSDLSRASETASIIGRALGLVPFLDSDLRERHGGIFQGYTGEKLKEKYPEALQAFLDHGQPPPGGESNLALARRATPALERIAAAHRGEMIALVTHGGTLRVLIAHIMGLPPGRKPPFRVSQNTGLTIAEMSEHERIITLLNDCCHLELMKDHPDGRSSASLATGDDGYAIG